jgi:hypothetical protein
MIDFVIGKAAPTTFAVRIHLPADSKGRTVNLRRGGLKIVRSYTAASRTLDVSLSTGLRRRDRRRLGGDAGARGEGDKARNMSDSDLLLDTAAKRIKFQAQAQEPTTELFLVDANLDRVAKATGRLVTRQPRASTS